MKENSNKIKEEYLCKAKILNSDEWVIGYYVRLHSGKKIIHRIYPGYAEQNNEYFYPDYYDINPDTLSRFGNAYDNPKLLDKTNNGLTIKDFLYNGKVKIIALPSREVSEKSIYHSLMGKEGKIVAMSENIIGVKIDGVSNSESKYDCFWFEPNCLEKIK